jgi:hypothetical protein
MMKQIAALLALALTMAATSAIACPGDKAKPDTKAETSQPATPKPGT